MSPSCNGCLVAERTVHRRLFAFNFVILPFLFRPGRVAENCDERVCLSVVCVSRCSIKRNERINLLFGIQASFDQSHTVI